MITNNLLDVYKPDNISLDQKIALRFRNIHIVMFYLVQEKLHGPVCVEKVVTNRVIEHHQQNQFNLEAVLLFLKMKLLISNIYDSALAQMLYNEPYSSSVILEFVLKLIHVCKFERPMFYQHLNMPQCLQAINVKVVVNHTPVEGYLVPYSFVCDSFFIYSSSSYRLLHDTMNIIWLEQDLNIRTNNDTDFGRALIAFNQGLFQARNLTKYDPPNLIGRAKFLLKEWIKVYMNVMNEEELIQFYYQFALQHYERLYYEISKLQSTVKNLLRYDYMTRFYCNLFTIAVSYYDDLLPCKLKSTRKRLIVLESVATLCVCIICGVIKAEHDKNNLQEFPSSSYSKMLETMFKLLIKSNKLLLFETLQGFTYLLHMTRPTNTPRFASGWMQLLSMSNFIGTLASLNIESLVLKPVLYGPKKNFEQPV
ncbi:unnamed protein product, partial [Didymodactylos carnosus]